MASVLEIIRGHEPEIMTMWRREARAAASARGLSRVALENILPSYLSALADSFAGGDAGDGRMRRKHVQAHLATRLRQGFDLAEIVAEFVMLERCIAAMWAPLPVHQRPTSDDIERLHAQFQLATTDVTDTFRRHMLDDEQSEKRYLRLLQGIASDALHEDTAPLRERLRELLELVKEAMGAQVAAFLAYDTSTSRLVLQASTGTEPLEPYAATLDPASFTGEVAAHDEPTSYDAMSMHLDVPEALRHSGIRSLLGVRLPAHHDLVGMILVGIDQAREFSTREIGRIASLGERLSVHLENARLFAALHDKIDALAIERALRDQFVSTLAHDLRGPLSAARIAAEIVATKPESLDVRHELAVKIARNIDRVDRMVRDLLDANRIRAGERMPLHLEALELGALAHRVADEASTMHGDRFTVDASDGAIRGIWSEDELYRALWNLVTNAVKYGAPDQPITLAVYRFGDRARLSVHNVGTPIPPAEQAHIFDAYARGRSASAGPRVGWGLGLTLVRAVAEAHGGSASVASERDVGTTFTLDLPLDARPASAAADEHAPSPGS